MGTGFLGLMRSLVMVVLLGACAPRAEDITMRCELRERAALVVRGGARAHQVGRVGNHVLVSWLLGDLSWTSRWYALPGFAPEGDAIDMGVGSERRPKWIASEGRLEGYLVADLLRRPFATTPVADIVTWWTLEPPPGLATPGMIRVDYPAGCLGCAGLDEISASAGLAGFYPTVEVSGRVVAALPAVPSTCGAEDTVSYYRLHMFGSAESTAGPVLWPGEPPCILDGMAQRNVFVPSLVPLSSADVGVFFRAWGPTPRPPQYVVVSPDAELRAEPRFVGGDWERSGTGFVGGWQVRAVRLGETILFVEGYERADLCHVVRLMNEDGSEVRDAPWQLPCTSDPSRATFSVELGTFGDYAVLAYSERASVEGLSVTATTQWDESVRVVLLTTEGRLASAPLIATTAESTALFPIARTETSGPPVENFHISLVADGDEPMVMTWTDLRPDAPGVYARELVCEPIPP